MKEILSKVTEISKKAGNFLLSHFRNLNESEIQLKGEKDFVTFVDKTSEEIIKDFLKFHFPEFGFLAEESGIESGKKGRFLIDPLDGTSNFIHGFPMFAVSIALEIENEIVLGVVYDPVHDELFYAEKGKGAYLNGKSISVSKRKSLSQAFLATGFPFKYKNLLPIYLETFHNIFFKAVGIRRAGSAALDLCYTACGRFDGFWEFKLKPWDIAAGSLILKEAGGVISDFYGDNKYIVTGNIVGSNGLIHEELLNEVRRVILKFGFDFS